MGIFSSIMDKIFHHPAAQAASPSPQAQPSQPARPQAAPQPAPQAGAATPAQAAAPGAQAHPAMTSQINVEGVLSAIAQEKGGGGNWRSSIVDLLKLLDLDSSLEARKTLASELNVHVGADGSAEENIALQHAVMQKLAENGGQVPDSLRH